MHLNANGDGLDLWLLSSGALLLEDVDKGEDKDEDSGDATLAVVSSAEGSKITLDLLVSQGGSWKSATFKRCFINKDGQMLLKPLARPRKLKNRALWQIEGAADMVNELPAVNLSLSKQGKLAAAALRVVERAGLRLRKH